MKRMCAPRWVIAAVFAYSFGAAYAARVETEDPATNCKDTGHYKLPSVPWMGEFAYKLAVTVQDGRLHDVEVQAIRGMDKASNRAVTESLREYAKANYSCDGPDRVQVSYLLVKFKHPGLTEGAGIDPQVLARLEVALAEKKAAYAARNPSAPASLEPGNLLIPVSSGMTCSVMAKPNPPRVNGNGTVMARSVVGVIDGRVAVVNTKLMRGSSDGKVNQLFIDEIERALRDTYRCPGDHVFEQEFTFQFSS